MITFVYTAKDAQTGQLIKAEVQAESEQAAAKLLISQKLFPITIETKTANDIKIPFLTGRVKAKDRVIFTRQLSTLIAAGLPITQSLRTTQNQTSNKTLNLAIGEIIAAVEGGTSLSAAFAKHPGIFNQIYVSLMSAGETSGSLDKTLERIATQQEKDAAILSKVRGAFIYPGIVLSVIIAAIIFMLTTVLPQVGGLYKDLGKKLPAITRGMIATSEFVIHQWWLALIIIAGLVFSVRYYIRTSAGRYVFDGLKMRLPIFGPILQKLYMARFARTMGALMASGVPMLEGLGIVKGGINNSVIENSLSRVVQEVKGGKALSNSIESDSNFLILLPQMIRVGEQSGALDDMLLKVANFYEDEVDQIVKNLSVIIEPAMMLFLGATVGVVVVAILLPIYSLVGQGVS